MQFGANLHHFYNGFKFKPILFFFCVWQTKGVAFGFHYTLSDCSIFNRCIKYLAANTIAMLQFKLLPIFFFGGAFLNSLNSDWNLLLFIVIGSDDWKREKVNAKKANKDCKLKSIFVFLLTMNWFKGVCIVEQCIKPWFIAIFRIVTHLILLQLKCKQCNSLVCSLLKAVWNLALGQKNSIENR